MTYGYLCLLIILAVATVMVFKSETKTESGIQTFLDSVWFTLVTVIAGYFDYGIKSVPGRIASIALLVLGMLLLSAVTGKIASTFMDMHLSSASEISSFACFAFAVNAFSTSVALPCARQSFTAS